MATSPAERAAIKDQIRSHEERPEDDLDASWTEAGIRKEQAHLKDWDICGVLPECYAETCPCAELGEQV